VRIRHVARLAFPCGVRKVAIEQRGCEELPGHRLDRAAADPQLPRSFAQCAPYGIHGAVGIEHVSDRLIGVIELVARPVELRRVHPGHLHHGDVNVRTIVDQLHPQRIGEAADGEFARAIGRLQWDRAIGERGAHLDDAAAVARSHHLERRERSMHGTEVRHLGDPTVFVRRDVDDRPDDRRHRTIDPYVNAAPFGDEAIARLEHAWRIRHVAGEDQPFAPGLVDVPLRIVQPILVTRNKADAPAVCAERGDPGST